MTRETAFALAASPLRMIASVAAAVRAAGYSELATDLERIRRQYAQCVDAHAEHASTAETRTTRLPQDESKGATGT